MALAVAPELAAYVTPYFVGGASRPMTRLPFVGRQLARRTLAPALATQASTALTITEFARVAMRHMRLRRFDYRLLHSKNHRFDRHVARRISVGADAVICQCDSALETFRAAKKYGTTTILDYPIARDEFGNELLREEVALHPRFAETATGRYAMTPRPKELERYRREIELADHIVVGSKFAGSSFNGAVPPERVRVIPYGVDTRRFCPGARSASAGPLRVLFAGQLILRKGLPYVLEATSAFDSKEIELALVGQIVGPGRWMAEYEGRFRYLGAPRPVDMPAIYHGADVLVLPSLVEGSAIVVYEAMASGIPVIVTPNAGADLVRDGVDGFVVPIRSPQELAVRMELLARDPELRERMGRSARERVLDYDWSAFRATFRDFCLNRI
jgi:glycosyltransferase involved in cell wall biosynthesis